MPNPRLASRYAKALLDLAIEKGQVEEVFKDVQWLQEACRTSREFVNVLKSPILKIDKKEKVVGAVIRGKVSEVTAAFVQLMIRKNREHFLPEVIPSFITQYKAHKNIYAVRLTTVAPLSEELKNAILSQIRATSDMQNIELETVVNEKLVGGFVLEAGDQLIDGSIAYDLKNIAKQFENNDFIYKIR